jgi:hypothetical protein
LQCAKCHNHPFDRWTQDDYYRWAGVFAQVQYKVLGNDRRDRNDKHEFDGEQIVWTGGDDEVTNPATNSPAVPRLLGTSDPVPQATDRLDALGAWIARPDHPLFARWGAAWSIPSTISGPPTRPAIPSCSNT